MARHHSYFIPTASCFINRKPAPPFCHPFLFRNTPPQKIRMEEWQKARAERRGSARRWAEFINVTTQSERMILSKATTRSARGTFSPIFDKVGSSGIIKTLKNQTQRLFRGRPTRGTPRVAGFRGSPRDRSVRKSLKPPRTRSVRSQSRFLLK